MKNLIADLHVHSGMKGYANHDYPDNQNRTLWDAYPRKEKELKKLNFAVRHMIEEISKSSQANLDACAWSHLYIPFVVICPVERPMFAIEPKKPFKWLINLMIPKKSYPDLGAAVSGFPRQRIQDILDKNVPKEINDGVNYYEQYVNEKAYLTGEMEKASRVFPNVKFRLADNYQEYRKLIRDENTIVGILTVEGAHTFGHYKHHTTFKKTYEELTEEEEQLLRESFLHNVMEVKNSDFPPFFVAFCHFFNNLLAGQARSLSASSPLIKWLGWPSLPGMRHVFNQEPNLNAGFSPLGRQVLKLFLDKEKGRRILIDAKHMSIDARREYYQYVRDRREQANDPIPIIFSHGAVTGWPTLDEAEAHTENNDLDKNTFFSRWLINLTDEDILEIYDSGGIIGLVLHEDRMPGGSFKKRAKKVKKRLKKLAGKEDAQSCEARDKCSCELKDYYLQLVWSNIFHIIKVVHDERGPEAAKRMWDMVGLGSDYDGLVNPFNTYKDVKGFSEMKQDMIEYLNCGKPVFYADRGHDIRLSEEEVEELRFGYTAQQLADKFFFSNVDAFLAKYFTPAYLGQKKEIPEEVEV